MPRNTIEIIITAKDQASRTLGTIGGNIQTLGKVALGGFGMAAGAAAGLGIGIAKLAIDAAPLESIEAAFAGLAESADSGADDMLAALKKGSKGMVTQRDLMLSFNKAAQLVSTDFAKRLPDAMDYLGKVSAATGQDLDYMLNSLVVGVGRLSPMILDNLAIQVDLSAAYETYAAQIGKSTDELTKSEQQTALMNQVMEKLAENTAAMPDISGTASAGLAQMRATLMDLKDQAGKAFLPALNSIIGTLSELAARVLPVVSDVFQSVLAPAINMVAGAISAFVGNVLAGKDPVEAFTDALADFLPPEVIATVKKFVAGVQDLINTVRPYVEQAIGWIAQHVELKDVLIALGIAISAVIIPIIISLISSVAPLIAIFAALVAVVVLAQKTFEVLKQFWVETLQPTIESLAQLLGEKLLSAWNALTDAIDWARKNVLDPLRGAFDAISGAVRSIINWIKDLIDRFKKIKIPDALKHFLPGSPSPFELGLRGITDAMRDLSAVELPRLQASLAGGGGAGGRTTNNYFNMTVHTRAPFSTVRQDFATMQALVG